MGLSFAEILVKKSHEAKKSRLIEFLMGSGAVYPVVQGDVMGDLRIKPHRKTDFFLANGERVDRDVGDAIFEYKGVGGAAPVFFGQEGDSNRLGAATLDTLELAFDPLKRELRPLSMTLMGAFPDYRSRFNP